MMKNKLTISNSSFLTVEDVFLSSSDLLEIVLSNDPNYSKMINSGSEFIDNLLKNNQIIYGVTTGYGDSVTVDIESSLIDELPLHLTRYHGCGLGKILNDQQTRAVMLTRMVSLSKGKSGVSWDLLSLLCAMLKHNILPQIPEEGSVGASGDLTPLSYIAGALVGERVVKYKGVEMSADKAFELAGLKPLKLKPKEGLAVMNGTAVMTGLACLAFKKSEYISRLATALTSLSSIALKGNYEHFDELLFDVKPHAGQQKVAERIRNDLKGFKQNFNNTRLQDRYSIRCAPHVIGVFEDAANMLRSFIENELNSSNDNPIIAPEYERVLHGGHFYGGHICFVADSLKNIVANIADLLDRQLALLVDAKYNNGLPSNLSGSKGKRASINHGFKAVQIAVSAWTAEALKLTMPASVFSRSTECHNQDKVSMGTIAIRDCLRIIELTEQVIAANLLAVTQALLIRKEQDSLSFDHLSSSASSIIEDIVKYFKFVDEDRPLDRDLKFILESIRQEGWSLYE